MDEVILLEKKEPEYVVNPVPEECQDVLHVLDNLQPAEGDHGVVQDNGDAIVEQRLAEHEEVELHVSE